MYILIYNQGAPIVMNSNIQQQLMASFSDPNLSSAPSDCYLFLCTIAPPPYSAVSSQSPQNSSLPLGQSHYSPFVPLKDQSVSSPFQVPDQSVAVPVGGHQISLSLPQSQSSHLAEGFQTSVDSVSVPVPEDNPRVFCASSGHQQSHFPGTPLNGLDSSSEQSQSLKLLALPQVPEVYLSVVAAGSHSVVENAQSAHLRTVAKNSQGSGVFQPYVIKDDGSVLGTGEEAGGTGVLEAADSGAVDVELSGAHRGREVKQPDCSLFSSDRQERVQLVELQTADDFLLGLDLLDLLAVVLAVEEAGRLFLSPSAWRVSEGDGESACGWGPVERVVVKLVNDSWRLENVFGSYYFGPVLRLLDQFDCLLKLLRVAEERQGSGGNERHGGVHRY